MNLERCVNYLNREVVGYSANGLQNWLEQPRPSIFRKMFSEILYSVGNVHLKGDDPEVDCLARVRDCFRDIYYDNGKPLTCDDYDYFDHYDRDQELWSWFEDTPIYRVFEYKGQLHCELDYTLEELQEFIYDHYDGSSYEHDFDEE